MVTPNKREEIINAISEKYSIDRDVVKKLAALSEMYGTDIASASYEMYWAIMYGDPLYKEKLQFSIRTGQQ